MIFQILYQDVLIVFYYLLLIKLLQEHVILNDLQKLLKYFNGTAIVAFFKTPFATSASVFSNN